jgi:hypothetical protein
MKRVMLTTSNRREVDELVSFSLEHLSSLRLPSGLYCHDMTYETREPRGESVRYSLMVLLGMQRAGQAGFRDLPDLDELWLRCLERQDSFTGGDTGLALWVDLRQDGAAVDMLLARLDRIASSDEALSSLVGMEVAWMLIGLAQAAASHPRAEQPLHQVSEHLTRRRRAPSGMYYHDASSRFRRRLPNFATEIYTLLALSRLARTGLAPHAREHARVLAEHLLRLQLPDGGWPWLFDADRASIVEPYEVYTVHQDAMAPMALLDLAELTGESRWADAAVAGLGWSRGENELGVDLIDTKEGFAHRSIRRRPPWDRLALLGNSIMSRTVGRSLVRRSISVEVNRTCRPYHLGWILEAWAGRQAADR